MLSARATLKVEYEKLHKIVLTIVREDAVCRRLMTVPSVGPLVAITYKSAMDDPNRIAKSKAAGALFGLTPKKYQSGKRTSSDPIKSASARPATTEMGPGRDRHILAVGVSRRTQFRLDENRGAPQRDATFGPLCSG